MEKSRNCTYLELLDKEFFMTLVLLGKNTDGNVWVLRRTEIEDEKAPLAKAQIEPDNLLGGTFSGRLVVQEFFCIYEHEIVFRRMNFRVVPLQPVWPIQSAGIQLMYEGFTVRALFGEFSLEGEMTRPLAENLMEIVEMLKQYCNEVLNLQITHTSIDY